MAFSDPPQTPGKFLLALTILYHRTNSGINLGEPGRDQVRNPG
jgi:hypothetical protein